MAHIMNLPNELLYEIAQLSTSDYRTLASLMSVNRLLRDITRRHLVKKVCTNPLLSRQVFLWAAEMGVHYWTDLLLAADTPVDPNTFYLSPIIRPRLLDTFQAQGRKGKAGPAYDNTFKTEIIREGVNRHPTNGYLHWASTVNWAVWSAANLGTMDLEDLKGFLPGHNLNLGHFGPVVNINTHSMGYWRWSAIHLAVARGDMPLVTTLLDHGANINAQCTGFCDCTMPGMYRYHQGVSPTRGVLVWTPLHVAMCNNNVDMVKLLLDRGASNMVGGIKMAPVPYSPTVTLKFTALQQAAWAGSVEMCALFLGRPLARGAVDSAAFVHPGREEEELTALGYAAAGGHMRTAGRALLDAGARLFLNTRLELSPLAALLRLGRLDDATWLLANYGAALPVRALSVALWEACRDFHAALARDQGPGAIRQWDSSMSLTKLQDQLCPNIGGALVNASPLPTTLTAGQRTQIVGMLLRLGAGTNVVPRAGGRVGPQAYWRLGALSYCLLQGLTGLAHVLIYAGAAVNARERLADYSRWVTPGGPKHTDSMPMLAAIEWAVGTGDTSGIQLLLRHNVTLRRPDGKPLLVDLAHFCGLDGTHTSAIAIQRYTIVFESLLPVAALTWNDSDRVTIMCAVAKVRSVDLLNKIAGYVQVPLSEESLLAILEAAAMQNPSLEGEKVISVVLGKCVVGGRLVISQAKLDALLDKLEAGGFKDSAYFISRTIIRIVRM